MRKERNYLGDPLFSLYHFNYYFPYPHFILYTIPVLKYLFSFIFETTFFIGREDCELFIRTDLSEKLKSLAKANFCDDCYQKYLTLIQGEIEYLLSDPISDWSETEENITKMFLKYKGYFKQTVLGTQSLDLSEEDLRRIRKSPNFYNKIDILHKNGILKENVYKFLDYVRKRRNKIHPPNRFSEQDYKLFRQAKELTQTIFRPILFDLQNDRSEKLLANVETYVKHLLSKLNP